MAPFTSRTRLGVGYDCLLGKDRAGARWCRRGPERTGLSVYTKLGLIPNQMLSYPEIPKEPKEKLMCEHLTHSVSPRSRSEGWELNELPVAAVTNY